MQQSGTVGAWDGGAFDNDDAADFSTELDDADPNQRLVLLRAALQAAVDSADLDAEERVPPRAIAAVAVIAASHLPPTDDSEYGPKFLSSSADVFDAPDDLVELALLALDAVADSDTEWAELYTESGTLDALRDALTA
jgi:hypothetical protein